MKTEPALQGIDYDLLADKLVERLRPLFSPTPPRYASAMDNPLGSRRAFLDAHRAGRLATFKRGREVLALWSDVEAYIESRKTRRASQSTSDEESLAAMVPKGKAKARKAS